MRRRVLMTVDAVGGVWTYALELAAALRPLGTDVVLAVLGPTAGAAQRAAAAAVGVPLIDVDHPLDWLAADRRAVAAAALAVADLARTQQVDVVHLNQPALAALATFGGPVVAVVHSCVATWWTAVHGGAEPADLAWQSELVGRGLHAAAAIVAPSHAFATSIAERYTLSSVAVVHNGRTPMTSVRPMRDFALTAGRLWDAGKGVATLDRAAARLAVPFLAAGALVGPEGSIIVLAHLQPLGAVDTAVLADHLAACPVFASAAVYEPFGLAVLEAALAGCALVLADTPVFRELWDGAATFVAPGDEAGFAAAITALIADRDERLAAGERAAASGGRYTAAAMAAGMAAIYGRVLAAPIAVAA